MTTHPAFVIRVDVKVILDTDWCSCALDGVKIVGYGQTDGQGVGLGIIPAPEVGQSFDASDPRGDQRLKNSEGCQKSAPVRASRRTQVR